MRQTFTESLLSLSHTHAFFLLLYLVSLSLSLFLQVDNIAFVYCAARVMRVSDLEKSTEAFMVEVVLRDPGKAAVVLKVATGIGASSRTPAAARALSR